MPIAICNSQPLFYKALGFTKLIKSKTMKWWVALQLPRIHASPSEMGAPTHPALSVACDPSHHVTRRPVKDGWLGEWFASGREGRGGRET